MAMGPSGRRRGGGVWLFVGVVVLAAACSSTSDSPERAGGRGADVDAGSVDAPLSDQTLAPGEDEGADATDEQPGADAPAARPGGSAAPSQGASAGGPGAASAGSGTGGDSGSGAAAPARPSGELKVGLSYGKAVDAFPGAVGIANGDGRAMGQAVVDWINAHGGAGGRTIKLVTYGELVTNTGPATDQAACTKFTQDEPVPLVVNNFSHESAFYECMADRGVPVITASQRTNPSQAFHMRFRNFLFSVTATTDREGATLADALARQKYFQDPGMKLGLLHLDEARWKDAAARFIEHAAAVRVKPTTVIATDDSQGSLQNAVVRFRSDGVTHVALLGSTAFVNQAAAQAYFPRYGMRGGYVTALNSPPQALRGTVGAGWQPAWDVAEAQEPPLNEPMKLCRKIMRDAGQDSEARIVQAQMQNACATFFLMKEALDRATTLDSGGLRDAIERIGGDWVPPLTFSAYFGPNRHDGSDSYRNLVYDTGCSCFRYDGPLIRMATLPGQT